MTASLLRFLLYFQTQSSGYFIIYKYTPEFARILNILWDVGIIYGYRVDYTVGNPRVIIYLKKTKLNNKISNSLIILSKSSKRRYIGFRELSSILVRERCSAIYLVSTSKGIVEGSFAVNKGLGGELICKFSI